MADASDMESGENFADLLAGLESRNDNLEKGQKISGKIITISGDDVFLDIGLKEDGIMDRKEVLDANGRQVVNIGDEVEGFIIDISSQGVKISRSMSGGGIAALEDAMAAGVPVEGRVKGVCKGGYQVEIFGKTAFCPGSQMEQVAEGEDLAGRQMSFLVTRIENHGRNIVVSRRALLERERQENLDKLLSSINIGDIIDGKVTRLAPFGAFVEIAPAVEGMAHISELSWSRVSSAEEAVSPGDMVKVKILAIGEDDKKRPRISLSLKQALADPWDSIDEKFKSGDVVEGKVVRLAPFGAFVEIAPGLEGLAHISELSWEKRINKPEEVLQPGDMAMVKIKDIDPASKRISLSLKDAQGDPWDSIEEKLPVGAKVSGQVEKFGPYGLFVRLLPGITGLVPAGVLKNSPRGGELSKLAPGASVEVRIQQIDPVAKRISLAPADVETTDNREADEKDWRKHERTQDVGGEGLMAQALKKAFQKKGDKNA